MTVLNLTDFMLCLFQISVRVLPSQHAIPGQPDQIQHTLHDQHVVGQPGQQVRIAKSIDIEFLVWYMLFGLPVLLPAKISGAGKQFLGETYHMLF